MSPVMSLFFAEGTKNQLREHLIEELDHVLVPTEAWDKLLAWYGIAEGQVSTTNPGETEINQTWKHMLGHACFQMGWLHYLPLS